MGGSAVVAYWGGRRFFVAFMSFLFCRKNAGKRKGGKAEKRGGTEKRGDGGGGRLSRKSRGRSENSCGGELFGERGKSRRIARCYVAGIKKAGKVPAFKSFLVFFLFQKVFKKSENRGNREERQKAERECQS